MPIKIEKLFPDAVMPKYMTPGAAGADLCAYVEERHALILAPGDRRMIRTGLKIAVPQGFEVQVRPRSGLALKHGVTVLNAPGTIDSDYRGEICVILVNLGLESFYIGHGDRIAQMVVAPVTQAIFTEVEQLEQTERVGGFGSTGGFGPPALDP
jgi:dUTP pyrophosphatase